MQLELSRIESSCLRIRILQILIWNFFLVATLVISAQRVEAQASKLDAAELDGEISGTVLLDADKSPASQVAVSLRSRVAGIFRSVLTDLEGRFKVQNLPRGTYDIAVEEQGYETTQTSAQLDGTSSKLVLYLKPKPAAPYQSRYMVSVRELKIPGKARSELEKGLERVAKNDLAGGLAHFTKATQAFPGYFEAYYNIGAAEMTLGHDVQARSAFQTSIDLSGGAFAPAEFGYGYLLCQEGNPGEAEKIIRRGLEMDDAAAEGYVFLSETLVRLKRLDEAEKSAHEALLRNPNLPGAYLALSDVAASKGDRCLELQDLDAYLRLQPKGPGSDQVLKLREAVLKVVATIPPQN